MRLPLWGLILGAGLIVAAGARVVGQAPPAGPGGFGPQLTQFGGQGGASPFPGGLGLLPGQETRLALYCIDLFNDAPTDRDEYRGAPDARAIATAGGETMPLHEAIAAGFLSVRGRDARTDGPRDSRQWIDLYVRNNTSAPVRVTYPAGYVFAPKGRTPPALAPGAVRMLEAAYRQRLTGSDTLAYAVWASRGFTREDVEETELRPIPDSEAAAVQKLLDAGGIEQRFDRDRGAYARLYARQEEALGAEAESFSGAATIAGGTKVSVTGARSPSGLAVVALAPARAREPLRYGARVRELKNGKAELELLHLKTGRRLQANRGRLVVRLAAS